MPRSRRGRVVGTRVWREGRGRVGGRVDDGECAVDVGWGKTRIGCRVDCGGTGTASGESHERHSGREGRADRSPQLRSGSIRVEAVDRARDTVAGGRWNGSDCRSWEYAEFGPTATALMIAWVAAARSTRALPCRQKAVSRFIKETRAPTLSHSSPNTPTSPHCTPITTSIWEHTLHLPITASTLGHH